jgi:hypothetical protein
MRRALLALPMLLAACEEPEPAECWGFWDMETAAPERDPAIPGLAVRTRDLSDRAHMDGVQRMAAWVTVRNLDAEGDCVVAVYASEAPVRTEALPALVPDAAPPAEIDGLGALQGMVNLAADHVGEPDEELFVVPLPAPAEGAPTWISVATCEGALVEVELELEGDYCGGWEDEPSFGRAFSRVF